ncbi:MAG: hypothetical protein WCF18_24090 [Chthoniobacteraceae bacterium]
MVRRILLLALLALACPAVLRAAAPEVAATPQGVTVSQEKVLPPAAIVREKPTPKNDDKVWSGLVLATNDPSPKDPPSELREFAPRLKRVFGYNQFELKGSTAKPIDADGESWLVPSDNFWLSVRARRALSKEARGGYLLDVHLYQDHRPLVATETKLAPGSPLFIRGPMCGRGQLIIVLQVQR